MDSALCHWLLRNWPKHLQTKVWWVITAEFFLTLRIPCRKKAPKFLEWWVSIGSVFFWNEVNLLACRLSMPWLCIPHISCSLLTEKLSTLPHWSISVSVYFFYVNNWPMISNSFVFEFCSFNSCRCFIAPAQHCLAGHISWWMCYQMGSWRDVLPRGNDNVQGGVFFWNRWASAWLQAEGDFLLCI